MELWITLGFVGVVGAIGIFFNYFINIGLNKEDSEIIDPLPENYEDQEQTPSK